MYTNAKLIAGILLIGLIIIFVTYFSPIIVRFDNSDFICGIICGFALCVVNCVITLLIGKLHKSYLRGRNDKTLRLTNNRLIIILMLTENVIVEELIFRSLIFSLLNYFFNDYLTIIFSSVTFVLAHRRPRIIELSLMGILFSYLVVRTNNLLTPIAAHATINILCYVYSIAKRGVNNI